MAASPFRDELIKNAALLSAPGKGFLAADESTGTIGKRFDDIKLENTEDNRRAYRELLFRTPGRWEEFISGVILYEETLFQNAADGVPFVEILKQKGILAGIKLDKGVVPIMGTDGETATQGLDDLAQRCQKYYARGARFAKWRNVIKISAACPSELAVQDCAFTLARYASISQANGLVPIVEPEVLMDGDHSIEQCAAVTTHVLATVFKALHDHNILLEGAVLKPNMVTSGASSGVQDKPEDVAAFTIRTLLRTVPPALPGIFFLSGGQAEENATQNLNAMNKGAHLPWAVSFSYGRAMQASALAAWQGKPENVKAGQESFLLRAKANSEAARGVYVPSENSDAAKKSLYQQGYTY